MKEAKGCYSSPRKFVEAIARNSLVLDLAELHSAMVENGWESHDAACAFCALSTIETSAFSLTKVADFLKAQSFSLAEVFSQFPPWFTIDNTDILLTVLHWPGIQSPAILAEGIKKTIYSIKENEKEKKVQLNVVTILYFSTVMRLSWLILFSMPSLFASTCPNRSGIGAIDNLDQLEQVWDQ